MTKRYDRAYFDLWYRGRHRVHSKDEVRRKVTMAVAIAEYFLRRPVKSALDVGCGEGAWLPHLRALRPRLHYLGVDPSEYAVARFGKERNLRRAAFGELAQLKIDRTFDLVVCSDVMHYLDDREIRNGVPELARLTGGLAYFEILTASEDVVGDLDGLIQRPPSFYRKLFKRHGLAPAGPYCWVAPGLQEDATALELQ